jgi:hypothetical protein
MMEVNSVGDWTITLRSTGLSAGIIGLEFNRSASLLTLFLGSSSAVRASTSGLALDREGTWSHIGMHVGVRTDQNGWFACYVNGSPMISYSGSIAFSDCKTDAIRWTACSGYYLHIDDLYIDVLEDETSPGSVPDKRFIFVPAASQGNFSEWLPSCVTGSGHTAYLGSKTNPEQAYLFTSAAGKSESFLVSDPVSGSSLNLHAVIPTALAMSTGRTRSAGWGLSTFLRRSGVTSVDSPCRVNFKYTPVWYRLERDPATNHYWAASNSTGIEVGFESEII